MSDSHLQLLILSRDLLLTEDDAEQLQQVFRALAKLTRRGCPLLLTAPEPEQWLPTRGNVDNALATQGTLKQAIGDAGGDLDGIYYVPRSLFTQDRNREGALKDILERYAVQPDQALLISASTPFVKAAERLGIKTHPLNAESERLQALEKALINLPEE